MKTVTRIILAIAVILSVSLAMAGPKAAKGGGKPGQGTTSGLETTIYDYCPAANAACGILSDGPAAGFAVYADSNLNGGDAGITLVFNRGDYSGTFRASSARRAWVEIDSAGCGTSFLGRLRFLRISSVESMGNGESRITGAYAQIDDPSGLIWNLFWADGSVQADRDGAGIWNVYSRTPGSVEIQSPGGRKKWVTCDTSATVDFDIEITQP